MNKRHFLTLSGQLATLGGAAAMGLLGSNVASAQSAPRGYVPIDPPVPTRDPETVEVLEFFWFGCPHCYAFEPEINAWKADKPDYVSFVREAPPLNPSWEGHSRSFYTAEALGVTDQFFDPMFNAIHQERRPLRDPKKIAAFAGELGIDEKRFLKTMNSFSVDSAMRRGTQIAQQSRITGVPSLLINGRYMTGGQIAGAEGIINVINRLVEEERKRMIG